MRFKTLSFGSGSDATQVLLLVLAREDQAVLCPGHRHVVEAAGLLGVRLLLFRVELLQLPDAKGLRGREGEPQAEPARLALVADAADPDVPVSAAGLERAIELGDRDHRELEALCAVHRHDPHAVVVLGLDGGEPLALVALGRLGRLDEERPEVPALVPLELRCDPHQLPHVRHPPRRLALREQREVVRERVHRPLDQDVEREQRRLRPEGPELLAEIPELRGVRLLDLLEPLGLGELVVRLLVRPFAEADLERRPNVPAARRGAKEPERVGRDPDGGAGERAEEHLVVERVGDDAEEAQDVLDLLLRPVAAPADHVRLEAEPPQRLLVGVHMGERPEEHDDVAAIHLFVVDQLAQPRGERPRLRDDRQVGLRLGPLHHALVVLPLQVLCAGPLLVGQKQLHLRRARNVLLGSFADDEVREVLEQGVAERVRRVEDRRT